MLNLRGFYDDFLADPHRWKKLLLGGLFVMLLVTLPIAIGYALRYLKNSAARTVPPLPEWTEFGDLWLQGLLAVIVVMVWCIPAILFPQVPGIIGQGLAGLWIALMSMASTYFIVRFAQTGDISVAFSPGAAFAYMQQNALSVAQAVILSWVVSILAGLGAIALGIGVFWTGFAALLVAANLYAQVWREDEAENR